MGLFKLPKVIYPREVNPRVQHTSGASGSDNAERRKLTLPLPWTGPPSRAREEVVETDSSA